MIRDDIFLATRYESPPEDVEKADERMQLLFARDVVPKDDDQADERMKLAGCYPTNLIGMVWQSPGQFKYLLEERRFKVTMRLVMDAGPRSRVWHGRAEAGDDKLEFVLHEAPHMTRTICARTLSVRPEYEEFLEEANGVIDHE